MNAPAPSPQNIETIATKVDLGNFPRPPIFAKWGSYNEVLLPNGVALYLSHFPNEPYLDIFVKVGTGSRKETDSEKGHAHLLEHMLLEHSSPLGQKMQALRDSVAGADSSIGGGTGLNHTSYRFRFPRTAVDTIGDITQQLMAPEFSDQSFDREKKVVRTEFREREYAKNIDLLTSLSALYPELGTPRCFTGTLSSIRQATIADIKKFHQNNYYGENISIAITGNLSGEVGDTILQQFSLIPSSGKITETIPVASIWQDPGAARYLPIFRPEQRLVECKFFFPLPMSRDPDGHIISLFPSLLTTDLHTAFNQSLRLNLGLTYSPWTSTNWMVQGQGFLDLTFPVFSQRYVAKAVDAVDKTTDHLRQELLPEGMLAGIKERTKMGIAEYPSGHHERVALSIVNNARLIVPEVLKEMIDKITVEDIRRVAGRIFTDRFLKLTGPISPSKNYLTNEDITPSE